MIRTIAEALLFRARTSVLGSVALALSCKYIHTGYTKLSGCVFLARAAERIEALADGYIVKTNSTKNLDEFSLRESAGDSASP